MSLKPVGELSISTAEFRWVVDTKEFYSKKNGESMDSPTFFVNDTIKNIYLQIFPKGAKNSNCGISLYLRNDNDYEITLDYSFSLLNNDGEKVHKIEFKNVTILSKNGKGWGNFISESFVLNPVNKLIKDGKVTLVCNIFEGVEKKYQKLMSINQKLFINQTHSDVTVKSNGKDFQLHKSILATRSTVFAAMFQADMVEKDKNIVEINDFDPEVLYQFFKYLYTNVVDNLKEMAKDLISIADKYLVTDLKYECEETMCSIINIENAIEYLRIADFYNANKLKSEALKFMVHNRDKLKDNAELDTLSKQQLLEIYKF